MKRLFSVLPACAFASLLLAGCRSGSTDSLAPPSAPEVTPSAQPTPTVTPTAEEPPLSRAEEILTGMTLHEKLCQLFVVYPEALSRVDPVLSADSLSADTLAQWPVGGFLLDKTNMQSAAQLAALTAGLQSLSEIPLILTCDEEGGRVNRLMSTVGTTKIGPMLDYEEQGARTAFDNAKTIASGLISFGFNLDLAPVADVWSNPDNTVIGDRAYSTDFSRAAQLVAAAVEGFHAGGAACTLKHFPGHGDTSADSHYGAVYVDKTLVELRTQELLPFRSGIEAGADMVMMGHLIVSDMDSAPAPFSHKIVTGLLREELGFDGVVITDSLEMGAVSDYFTSGEIAVNCIRAGVDLLLCPTDLEAAVSALTDAVETGAILEERIDESVLRILELKLRQGILT